MKKHNDIIKFSFIIPTYNRSRLVQKAINSILKSNESINLSIEIIVIDDGSIDDTNYSLRSYVDSKIIYLIENEHNLGANTSRNKGVILAKGQYCIFLDSDDALEENALEFMFQHFSDHPTCQMFFMSSSVKKNQKTHSSCYLMRGSDYYSLNEISNGAAKGDFLPIIKTALMKNHLFFDGISGFEGSVWIWLMLDGYNAFYTEMIGQKKEYLNDGLSVAIQLAKRIDTLTKGYDVSLQLFGLKLNQQHPSLYGKFFFKYHFYNKISSFTTKIELPKPKIKYLLLSSALSLVPRKLISIIWNYKNKKFGV